MKTAFIGHRDFLPSNIGQRLQQAIQNEIALGCKNFIMGTHGEFDKAALSVCQSLRETYPDIKIEVVITSLAQIQSDIVIDEFGKDIYPKYTGVETVMYEIEDLHYKQRITASNRRMIDDCDTLICYVRPKRWRSGADAMMKYAQRQGLKIVNLYHSDD